MHQALSSLLAALSSSRSLRHGEQLHAHLLRRGFIPVSAPSSPFSHLSNQLITFYSRFSLPLLSLNFFLSLPSPSPSAWSAIISALSQHRLAELTLCYFHEMRLADVGPSDRSIPSVVKSVGCLFDVELAKCLHGLSVKTPFSNDVFVLTSLVDMYMKCAQLGDVQKVFDFMPERNVVSWSALISGYSDARMYSSALLLFHSALANGIQANDFTFSSVIRSCNS
ncbi:hypothetical protein LUZ60_002086 [Juncus effusus]|nr:hypothetical protein LUZ60_002086 [Juncus effusus]